MDPPKLGHGKQDDARAEDPAIFLFGQQITNLSTKEGEISKEELSPRGVDEKGLSFATSSDDDDDLNTACEDSSQVKQSACEKHARKRKATDSKCAARDHDAAKQTSDVSESTTVKIEADNHAGKLKAGMWSRCPRCNSSDTKFCYFNNYNVNQPRHFCKHCQRYWTAGGTLRNVPIGAGKRKNKHVLHKHNFAASSTSVLTVPTASPIKGVADVHSLSIVKSDPLPTSESNPFSMVEPDRVNTNLELSAHHSFTDPPMPSLTPCNIFHPQSAHKLITLHQLHDNLQSRLGQTNHPHLATVYPKLDQIYPNLACGSSPFSPIHPEMASGCSKLSQLYPNSASGLPGLSQISPFLPNGSYGLSQICPHLCSGFPGLHQICPGLQSGSTEFARLGSHLQTGSFRFCCTHPPVQGGVCKTRQECMDGRRNELSALSTSERGVSETKGNLESELPMSDQKKASLERGLPDLARTESLKDNLENKASSLLIGHPEVNRMELDNHNHRQRPNEMQSMRCSASNECKVHMRGACNGIIETEAPPVCMQGDLARGMSSSGLSIQSEEAFNIENIMKRGVGEEHSGLPFWAGLWPYFYNMFWVDPLAFPHFRPMLTPQGLALPFIPPKTSKFEAPSDSPNNGKAPTASVAENFAASSTLTTISPL